MQGTDKYISSEINYKNHIIKIDDILIAVGVDSKRSSNGWIRVRSMEEVISLVRSPTFRANEENFWIIRENESFYGQLIPDDPDFQREAQVR